MNCLDCEEFGKYWVPDPETGSHIYKNWDRNWLGCRIKAEFTCNPEKCPKNAKMEVEM